MRYQIWNQNDHIFTPGGQKYTPEQWKEAHPWIDIPGEKMVIETGTFNGAFCMPFRDFCDIYIRQGLNITDDMSDEEVLAAIEGFELHPPGSDEPSVQERTAAALEFLAMNSLPDESI